jgi:hypothetical protein
MKEFVGASLSGRDGIIFGFRFHCKRIVAIFMG